MSIKEDLLEKISQRTLKVGVMGLGYVGLPLAVEKAKAGYFVTGFDIQQVRVDEVNKAHNYIGDVVDIELEEVVLNGLLTATTNYDELARQDFIAICVPTPLDDHQQPDLSCVENACKEIGSRLRRGQVVVLESTSYPGTTEELLMPQLEGRSGLKCGEDFFLGFSPERVDPGNLIYKTANTPKVVGGIGEDAGDVISSLYRSVLKGEVTRVSSPRVAEMEKILENTYRNINVALANEMAMICHEMGINVWEVINAAATKPYGFQPFYPGPGLGGHCIPLDPWYLTWKAKQYGLHTRLIETSGQINDQMPRYVVKRAGDILNQQEKSIKGSDILLLGVAYKQDIDDCRESPALKVMSCLVINGARVDYYDPYVSYVCGKRGLESLNPEVISRYDLVIITTGHTCVDYEMVAQNAHTVFDTKNAAAGVQNRNNIILL